MNIYNIRNIASNTVYKFDTLFGLNQDKLNVLCFHGFTKNGGRYDLDPEVFEQMIVKISKTNTFCDLGTIDRILRGEVVKEPHLLITIDDGFSNILSIRPIVKKYNLPIVLFILSKPHLRDKFEIDSNSRLLTWKQVELLQKDGWTIGCHSATHRNFNRLDEEGENSEIVEAKRIIESTLNTNVVTFAYPRGYYGEKIINKVKKTGYKYAFTIDAGSINKNSNRYLLPRTIIDGSHAVSEVPAVFSSSWYKLRKLTNKLKLWEIFLR